MENDLHGDETPKNEEEINNTEHQEEEETITLTKAELEAKLAERAKEQDKRWKARVGNKDEKKEKAPTQETAEYDRMFLDTKGVETDDEQDVVLDFAKKQGISVRQALKDDFVQFKLEKMRKQDKEESSIPSPSGRGATRERGVDYYVQHTKEMAPTPEMRKEVRRILAKKK